MQIANEALRYALRFREALEAALAISRQSSDGKTNPDVARLVFAKGRRKPQLGRWQQPFPLLILGDGSSSPVPALQAVTLTHSLRSRPDISSRVLKKSKDRVQWTLQIDGFGMHAGKRRSVCDTREAIQAIGAGQPPFARSVLDDI